MPTVHLSAVQTQLHDSPARFRYVVSGRRVGKTIWLIIELALAASRKPRSVNWYIAPTYTMARDIAWQTLLDLLPSRLVRKTNSSRLQITLNNGATISLKGVDNPQSLRGRGLDFAALDEYAMHESNVWPEVIRPMLATSQGRACFGSTPMGFNHAYDLFQRTQSGEMGDEWQSWMFTTAQGGFVSASELAAARRELDPRIFRQEFEASFEALVGRVYSNFERLAHCRDIDEVCGQGEVLIGMDFNVNPMTFVIGHAVNADTLYISDAVEIPSSNTQEACDEIKVRYPQRRIIVCPDPSGRNRTTASLNTNFTILEAAGFVVDAPNRAPMVTDRVNAVQSLLRSADQSVRLYVHPRAGALIRTLEGQQYKVGTSIPAKTGLDHAGDALGYLVWQQFNVLHLPWSEARVRF